MVAPDSSNGRVTLAVLGSRLDGMETEMARRFDKLEEKLDQVCNHTNDLDQRVTRNEERIKQNAGFLATLSIISSTIAGAIGSVIK